MDKELINIVRTIKNLDEQAMEYADSIPIDLRLFVMDNEYVNIMSRQKDLLLEGLFGEYAEDVCWFLYEFKAGKHKGPHLILADGTEYTYNSNEDYYEYLETL